MRTILLNSGITLLQQQGGVAQSTKLKFTGFRLGTVRPTQTQMETWDNNEASLSTMTGTTVLVGDNTYMRFNRKSSQESQIMCRVPPTSPQIEFGNVVLYASVGNGTAAPFVYAGRSADFIKLGSAPDGSPGYGWWFHLMLQIPNIEGRFDFTNLPVRYAEFETATDENALGAPWTTLHDQLMLDRHTYATNPQPVLNVGDRFWGCPLMELRDTDNVRMVISGGEYGDNYQTS